MQVNLIYDSSLSQAPSGFSGILNQAVQFLDQTFTNAITVNIQVGWQEVGGTPLSSGVIGEGGPSNGRTYTYNQVRTTLAASITSTADSQSVLSLPASDPTHGGQIYVASAEEKALSLRDATSSAIDGQVGFQGDAGFGDVVHEITHAMGRVAFLGLPGNSNQFSVLDLFRYTGPGTLSPSSRSAFFSLDGGKTVLNTFSKVSDFGDWAGATPDAFNAFGGPNDPVTSGDLQVMDVLGFALNNPSVSGKSLTLGATPTTVLGGVGDTIIGGAGTAVINATAGSQSIVGGSGATTVFSGNGDTIVAGSGNTYIDGTSGGQTIFVGSAGTDILIGTVGNTGSLPGDTLIGGAAAVQVQGLGKGDIVNFVGQSGSATVNGTAGGVTMAFGSGSATVYAGAGDAITLGTGNQYVDGLAGGAKIGAGPGGTDIIIGSLARTAGAGVDTLVGGAAFVQVQGLGRGDIVNFAGQSGNSTINATAGNISVTLGNGNATVYGGGGDTVSLGSANQYVDGLAGGVKIQAGSGGLDIIIGSMAPGAGTGPDTITGGAAAVQIQGLGKGDIVNLSAQTGNASINATAGNNAVMLGSGGASVYAGAGDTITMGSVSQYVDARAAGATTPGGTGALINMGSAGTGNIIGSTVAGAAGITVKGGAANLNYNPGTGNDLIDLTGSTGSAVVNGFGSDRGPVNDTVIAGNGATSVWGGQGDRIGVGFGANSTYLFTHATTIGGAAIGFGSNDNAAAVAYGSSPGANSVNGGIAGTSSARVTVSGFAETAGTATDYIFYQNPSAATNTSIVTTSTQVTVTGLASTMLTLPDGTVMTLVGVSKADFNTGFFKT